MDEVIDIKHSARDEWLVIIKGAVTTRHRVRVGNADLNRLGQGQPAERLIEESFRFLLEREPNSSILPSFDLTIIGRYFPEYETEIRTRLENTTQ